MATTKRATMKPCECSDTGCPCGGQCDTSGAIVPTTRVYRIDMDDGRQGFNFCDLCAQDALESGVFGTEPATAS